MSSTCPRCGAHQVVPIMYGLPGTKALELADKGLLGIGGCDLIETLPCWLCRKCRHSWGTIQGAEGEACEQALTRIFQAERAAAEAALQEQMCPAPVRPWLEHVLTTAAARGAECLVIDHAPQSRRLEDCPTAYLVEDGRLEWIEDGGLARALVEQRIPREGNGPEQSIRVRLQGREVVLGLEQRKEGPRRRLLLRLDALAGLELTPRESPKRPPSCRYCDSPLRTPRAPRCFRCGMDWSDPNHVVNSQTRR